MASVAACERHQVPFRLNLVIIAQFLGFLHLDLEELLKDPLLKVQKLLELTLVSGHFFENRVSSWRLNRLYADVIAGHDLFQLLYHCLCVGLSIPLIILIEANIIIISTAIDLHSLQEVLKLSKVRLPIETEHILELDGSGLDLGQSHDQEVNHIEEGIIRVSLGFSLAQETHAEVFG